MVAWHGLRARCFRVTRWLRRINLWLHLRQTSPIHSSAHHSPTILKHRYKYRMSRLRRLNLAAMLDKETNLLPIHANQK